MRASWFTPSTSITYALRQASGAQLLRTYSERVTLNGKSVMGNSRGIDNSKSVALTLSHIEAGPRHLRTANIAPNAVDHRRIRHGFDIIQIVCGEIGRSGLDMRLVHGGVKRRACSQR